MRSLQTAPGKHTATRVIGKPTRRAKKTVKAERKPKPQPVPVAPIRHDDVRQRAMLVKLSIHRWPAKATDHQISDEVAEQHGIASDMGKYSKQLLPKTALEKLRSAGSRLRARHNRLTLPWDEWSTRILSAKAYLTYNADIRPSIDEFDQIFHDELEAPGASGQSKYQEAKEQARQLLGSAFRETDYPTLAQLKRKFRAHITVMPIPDSEDFRIDLGAEETAQVRAEIENRVNDQLQEAMKELYGRVGTVVGKLAAALKAETQEDIRHTLFMAINNVLETLPLLNVTADPRLDVIADEIRFMVTGCDVKGLKESQPMRTMVIEQADAILAKVNDFLG